LIGKTTAQKSLSSKKITGVGNDTLRRGRNNPSNESFEETERGARSSKVREREPPNHHDFNK